ncbi:hypothetical protein C2845_PM05G13110 [Panicum miliaceum]|uniref:AIG1-type G domain-containing protein n=1 Tax=Panicum miliaceum TaxID=4540 RepID=A0A3L6SVT4_PANMI|nr:hypothetical protein C2845_PM05G13110 [Panicum miliaceum]
MATTTDGTLVASMEEQNPASVVTEEEPPKKAKLATATTNEAVLAPLVDENLASMEEEAPKKVEMLAVAEEGKETFKKVMVNDEEKEMKDVGSEGKGRSFAGLEVMNSEAEGDTGVNNGEEVEEPEEDSKGRSLDAAGTMNYDANEVPALQDTKVVVSMLELAPMPIVRSKLENGELGEDDVSLVSPNVYEGEEGGELREEQQKEEEVAVVVEAKVADNIEDDTESVVDKVKLEPKSEKVKEVKSGGMDGGKSSEVKEVDISIVTIKVVEPEDRLSSFAELNVKYGYQKEASDDPMIMGCEEGLEGSTEQDVDVPTSEASKVIVNDGSIKEFALASADNVLEDIPGTEQNAEGQAATNEVVEDVGGEKLSKFENIVATVEEVGVKKHIEGMKNDVSGELEAHKTEVVISMVELTQIPAVESKLEDGELREEDALLASHDVSDGKQREKVGAMVQAKVADKVENNADSAMAGEKKAEPDGEKVGKVESRDQDGGKLDEEKETKVSIFSVKTAEQEDKLAPFDKDNGELSYRKEASDDIVVVGGEEAREESIERDDNVPMNEAINDRSIEEVFPRSANNMLEDSLGIEKNDEGQTTTNEVAEVVGVKKPLEFENIADMVEDIGIEKRIEVENIATVVEDVDIERHTEAVKDDANRELETQDTESVIFVVELTPMPTVGSKSEKGELWGLDASLNSPNSSEGKKIDELQEKKQEEEVTANKVVEDVGVEKPSEVENAVVIEDVDVKKYIEVEHVAAVEGIDVEKLMKIKNMASISVNHILSQELAPESSKKNNDAKESECSNEVIDHEKEVDNDSIIKAVTDEDGVDYEAYEYNDGANSDTSPALIAILESAESTKQIMKEFTKGSSNGSMDGQNMPDDSKEDDDNDDGDKQEFVSAALTALLEGETSGTSYGNITLSSHDGSEILTMDGPARPGSSIPSLMPTAPCLRARSNTFSPTELAVTANPAEEMTEEEKNLHDKVELIRVKFLRLVYRLGATFEEIVTSLVLYRLSLVEGIMHVHGRHTNQDFSLDNAWKKALILEAEGKEDLNFSCNILVLGKTGVGKSATINSIFGEDKSKIDAFSSATTSVREYVGDVHGIKIRIIDTPGFQTSVMDQGSNRKILAAIKKYTKKCPPDIILYVDRLDSLSRDHNDLPLLKTITSVLGSSVWFNAIVALTHAASAPPEGLNGAPVTYEVLMAQRSHVIHQSIRQAAGDMCLMNPIALVENHPSCKRNHEGHKVLPNGQSWRHQMLFLCYSSKILCEANSLLKFQDPNPRELFGFHFPTLPFMLSSLMQSRAHPKLSPEQGGKKGDFHIKLDEYFNVQQDDDGENNDRLPPFKPLTKAQLARLTRKQKKQWKNEICKLKEMKKRGGIYLDDYGYANIAGENDHDPPLDNVSVPLPNIVLPPSFDCDNPTYRYRFLEPTSTILARPILDANGWDHDYGYDGVSMEETLAILDRFPANVAVQVTKDKKEFSIHLDSSIAIKHGENASSLAGFDIQTAGQQPAYILRGETKIKNIKKNETTGGFSVTFLGDTLATGLKVENQLSLGNRLSLVASTGAMQAQGDTAYGANLEACLKDKHYPIGQSQSTLGLSLMKSGRDLALDANLQSQFSIGRGSKMALRLGLNNKLSGQITVRTSTSDQVQIALLGLVPVAASIYRSFRPTEPSSV